MKKYFSLLLLSGLFAASSIQAGNEAHLKRLEYFGECRECDLSSFDLRPVIEKLNAENKKIKLAAADLEEANISGCKLANADLQGAFLYKINAKSTNFENANLNGAMLAHARAQKANFTRANLNKAYLGGAKLYKADFSRANIKKADFSAARLKGANLFKVNAESTNFRNANLKNAIAENRYVSMKGGYFKNAYFGEAKLRGADIPGVTDFLSRIRAWWNSK